MCGVHPRLTILLMYRNMYGVHPRLTILDKNGDTAGLLFLNSAAQVLNNFVNNILCIAQGFSNVRQG